MATDISPSLGQSITFNQAGFAAGYDAIAVRRAFSVGLQEGVIDAGSYMVTERASGGAAMFVDIAASTGDGAIVTGDSVTSQGKYHIAPHSALITEAIAAADASNPRVDQVILEALDDTHAGGGLNKARVRVLTGTATAGATLDNRSGAAALPSSAIRLADVHVPASDTTITNAQIRDRRPWARGAYVRSVRTAGSYTTTSGVSALVDSTNMNPRIECSGGPLRMRLMGRVGHSAASGYIAFNPYLDSALADGVTTFTSGNVPGAGTEYPLHAEYVFSPSAGSHKVGWGWYTGSATATLYGVTTSPHVFEVEEIVGQNTANNTTTTG